GPAHDMALAGGLLADLHRGDVGADLNDLAEELMTDHQGRLDHRGRPVVPLLEVQVRATQSCPLDPDQHVVGADCRPGPLHELESGSCGGLYEGSHVPDPAIPVPNAGQWRGSPASRHATKPPMTSVDR